MKTNDPARHPQRVENTEIEEEKDIAKEQSTVLGPCLRALFMCALQIGTGSRPAAR
jgi:hypothetical protein